jgi:hypothetical protein
MSFEESYICSSDAFESTLMSGPKVTDHEACIMSILTRLFGSKKRPTITGDQAPTARSLLKSRTPPWHQVAPIVIDAIFEALADTELFDFLSLRQWKIS